MLFLSFVLIFVLSVRGKSQKSLASLALFLSFICWFVNNLKFIQDKQKHDKKKKNSIVVILFYFWTPRLSQLTEFDDLNLLVVLTQKALV
jgi:hypothetical protein